MKRSSPIESEHQRTRHPAAMVNTSLVSQAFVDNRESTATQRQLMAAMANSPQATSQRLISQQIHGSPRMLAQRKMLSGITDESVQRVEEEEPLQGKLDATRKIEDEEPLQGKFATESPAQPSTAKSNNTGLPDNLKSGIEHLSGMSMDHVKVHYNSSQPAQLNALAYAQGSDIHVAPGQEQHLPHEAWHVVQQAQGRVRPTMQMQGSVPVNDDAGLEREADVMGAKALQGVFGSPVDHVKPETQPYSVAQCKIDKLRIGIIGPGHQLDIYANTLPANTNVWILSNRAVDADALDNSGVTKGQNKSSPSQIINANTANVGARKRLDESRSGGVVSSRFFQSGEFLIPRQDKPSNRNEVDYSFLRYAAFESYKLWHASTGNALGWPSLTANTTLVESIDSDIGGITGSTNDSSQEMSQGNNKVLKTDWLAEAGSYIWDWTEVKDLDIVKNRFTPNGGSLDIPQRDQALKKFSEEYYQAELSERETAKSSDIFRIYFPEPATRLSPSAFTLLGNSAFGNLKITRGTQLGHKRESIGLIAGLVFLDMKETKNTERSKSKLKFDSSYKVTTGLGERKGAYASVFLEWHSKAANVNGGSNDVSFTDLNATKEFDQSYLNPGVSANVLKWHNATLDSLEQEKEKGASFFSPKA